jgi:hypothetical protein
MSDIDSFYNDIHRTRTVNYNLSTTALDEVEPENLTETFISRVESNYTLTKYVTTLDNVEVIKTPLDINTLSPKMKARALDIEEGKEYKIL